MTVRCQLCPSTWIMPTPITQVFPNEPSLETLINRKEVQEFHIKRTKHSLEKFDITGIGNRSNLVLTLRRKPRTLFFF